MRAVPAAVLVVTVLVLAGAGSVLRGPAAPLDPGSPETPLIPGVDSQLIRVQLSDQPRAIDLVIGPLSIPAGAEGVLIPVQLARIPVNAWLRGFSWSMVAADGRALPRELLHHVNLIDPDRRELFGPTSRRVVAAGRETSAFDMPPVVGYPLARGTRLLVAAMFANPGAEPLEGATLRVRLPYSPRPRIGPEPLPVFAFHMDVMGPVGNKSFPVPPGRTVRSWQGSPAADVRVLALGGHMHDHTRVLLLEDVTTGATLWRAEPIIDKGRVQDVPRAQTWRRGGLPLRRSHVYRVTVEYQNDGAAPLPHGGMGLVAGVAAGRAAWPAVDRQDPIYAADLASLIAAPRLAAAGHGSGHGAHMH